MARSNDRYKSIYNRALSLIESLGRGAHLPAESALALELDASRTTIRAVLARLSEHSIIDWQGRSKRILRKPLKRDRYRVEETRSTGQRLESAFMERLVNGDLTPTGSEGLVVNETELARSVGVSATAAREFLIRFSRFGLIDKRPGKSWLLKGFTRDYALEISDVRELFERHSVALFAASPARSKCRSELAMIRERHDDLLPRVHKDYLQFQSLDEDFHRVINSVAGNRFVDDFQELVALIFHYHYRWNKKDERERNAVALQEHLDLIDALDACDARAARRCCDIHLATARQTLLRSIDWE